MNGVYVAIAVAVGAAMSFLTGQILYRIAPVAGYSSEADRRAFRSFGYEWGWLTPLPALAYWATQLLTARATPANAPTVDLSNAVLGSRGLRFVAAVIDSVIVTLLAALVFIPLLLLAGAIGGVAGALLLVLAALGTLAVAWLYAPVCMMRDGDLRGQTYGKQWLGLWVVPADGGPLTLRICLMRQIVGRDLLSLACGFYGFVDAAWCLFDDRKQTLHDKVGKTIVVTAR